MTNTINQRDIAPNDEILEKTRAFPSVRASNPSRAPSDSKPQWNISTIHEAKRNELRLVHTLAERAPINMLIYNFRAEKLPRAYPVQLPKTNKFNHGLLHLRLEKEIPGESFDDERVAKGIHRTIKEIPNHPTLQDKKAWNFSSEVTKKELQEKFELMEAQRIQTHDRWKSKLQNYQSPQQKQRTRTLHVLKRNDKRSKE